jgi:hypothetical protein
MTKTNNSSTKRFPDRNTKALSNLSADSITGSGKCILCTNLGKCKLLSKPITTSTKIAFFSYSIVGNQLRISTLSTRVRKQEHYNLLCQITNGDETLQLQIPFFYESSLRSCERRTLG